MQDKWCNEKCLHDVEDVSDFFKAIDRSNLTKALSSERAYVYWTMEVYDNANGIKGGGGLGVLAADTRRVAQDLDIPFVVVTPFYQREIHQGTDNLSQTEFYVDRDPIKEGFSYIDEVTIKTVDNPDSKLAIFEKTLGTTKFVTISESNFGELYAGDGSGDHRLYQEVSLGFGGYYALKRLGIKPAVIQLNETATIFAAIARLDELVSNGMNLYEAIVYVRKHTLYTNHTLLQAAEGAFSQDQFRRFVYPNIRAKALIRFIDEQFAGVDRLRLSSLAIELCEAKSCVSRLHARVADFKDRNGDKVKFNYVTNGIHIKTWVLPEIRDLYCKLNILDHFDLPTINYKKNLELLTVEDIKRVGSIGRDELNKVLSKRKDQYGNAVSIPNEALVFNFKRRFANYKRPYMVFENIETFKNILLKHNAHFILAGKVHLGDTAMYEKLKEILKMIDQDIVLKERVHYIQDYDEELARALAVGSDIAINAPVVGLEACGTSWEKDIANFKLLISTNDGGVADLDNPPIFEVKGKNYEEELASLYKNMEDAATAVQNDLLKRAWVIKELTGYLPVISGARMLKDYLTYLFSR